MAARPQRRSRFAAESPPAGTDRPCEVPGCPNQGEFKAPKSRNELNQYRWFCLDHVRAYNAAWDYYKGMTPGQIEQEMRASTTWGRPTWPLGRLGGAPELRVDDVLGMFAADRKRATPPPVDAAPPELKGALATLNLAWPVTREQAKARWRELVKIFHPDANGGSAEAEARVKQINEAYSTLRGKLPATNSAAA
jgi:hypothetical protein